VKHTLQLFELQLKKFRRRLRRIESGATLRRNLAVKKKLAGLRQSFGGTSRSSRLDEEGLFDFDQIVDVVENGHRNEANASANSSNPLEKNEKRKNAEGEFFKKSEFTFGKMGFLVIF
jgi:hypothetical protein